MNGNCVHAVVVAFYPDMERLRALLVALSSQVKCIHLVDNTPGNDSRIQAFSAEMHTNPILFVAMNGNQGLAAGLNEGIKRASAGGAEYVLLSDQDSLPLPGMTQGLMRAISELRAKGVNVAAVGPVFTDEHTGYTFPFQTRIEGKFFYGHQRPNEDQPFIDAYSLITSGTLAPIEIFAEVGLMREDYFIDNVDVEWCHRARAKGYKVFGTNYAYMGHRLGDDRLDIWYFGSRSVSVYSPIRIYYQVRNYVALCREGGIDLRWKIRNGWYTFGVVYSQVFFGKYGSKALRMALRGLWDGLRNRMGRYEPA